MSKLNRWFCQVDYVFVMRCDGFSSASGDSKKIETLEKIHKMQPFPLRLMTSGA